MKDDGRALPVPPTGALVPCLVLSCARVVERMCSMTSHGHTVDLFFINAQWKCCDVAAMAAVFSRYTKGIGGLACQEGDSDACVGNLCAAVLTLKPDRLELKAAREAKAAAKAAAAAAALEQQQQLAQQQQQLGQPGARGAGAGAGAAGADGAAGLVYLIRSTFV
eukprot:COSAG06_NODE_6220_length_3039_cov_34.856803_4_plen_165_part_00